VFNDELGAAICTICMGAFVLIINTIGAQGGNIVKLFRRKSKGEGETA
jgi:hypothetical protein